MTREKKEICFERNEQEFSIKTDIKYTKITTFDLCVSDEDNEVKIRLPYPEKEREY